MSLILEEEIARFAIGIALPDTVLEAARLRLLDALGIGLAGAKAPAVMAVLETVKTSAGIGPCGVIGHGITLSPIGAAMVNAAAIHAFDFDDTYMPGAIHTHSTIIPAALAAADECGADIATLYRGMAVGTEVTSWLSKHCGRALHARGFHPTALLGAIGAAVAASVIFGLDEQGVHRALGMTGIVAGGTWQFEESWVKNWNVGWAAQTGLQAAFAARANFLAPHRSLSGAYGLLVTHGVEVEDVASLGLEWTSLDTGMKRFGVCQFLQSILQNAISLSQKLDVADVARAVVHVPDELAIRCVAEPIDMRRRPSDPYRARFAGQWLVAHALVDKRNTLATYDDVPAADPLVENLADRIEYDIQPFANFPEFYPSAIEVHMKSGEVLTAHDDGEPICMNAGNTEVILTKFVENLEYAGIPAEMSKTLQDLSGGHLHKTSALWQMLSAISTNASSKSKVA